MLILIWFERSPLLASLTVKINEITSDVDLHVGFWSE